MTCIQTRVATVDFLQFSFTADMVNTQSAILSIFLKIQIISESVNVFPKSKNDLSNIIFCKVTFDIVFGHAIIQILICDIVVLKYFSMCIEYGIATGPLSNNITYSRSTVYIHIPYITTLYRYRIDMIYNRNSDI